MKERPILFSGEMVRAILGGRKTQTRRVVIPQPETRRDLFPTEPEDIAEDRASKKLIFAIRTGALSTRCLGAQNFAQEFCPFGQAGDRLWVREAHKRKDTFAQVTRPELKRPPDHFVARVEYRADGATREQYVDCSEWRCSLETNTEKWKPSIHMPRWASRITLELTGVRVERVQEIVGQDAIAEGVARRDGYYLGGPHRYVAGKTKVFSLAWQAYKDIWNHLNEKRGYSWDSNPWVWVIEFKRVEA